MALRVARQLFRLRHALLAAVVLALLVGGIGGHVPGAHAATTTLTYAYDHQPQPEISGTGGVIIGAPESVGRATPFTAATYAATHPGETIEAIGNGMYQAENLYHTGGGGFAGIGNLIGGSLDFLIVQPVATCLGGTTVEGMSRSCTKAIASLVPLGRGAKGLAEIADAQRLTAIGARITREQRGSLGGYPVAAKVVETERIGQSVKASEATSAWDEFLGAGEHTNIHPRLGTPDPNRIVSADGTRSVRFGPHEMDSSPNKLHYHEETWAHDPATNTWSVENVLRRARP